MEFFLNWLTHDGNWAFLLITIWALVAVIEAIGDAVAKARGHKEKDE